MTWKISPLLGISLFGVAVAPYVLPLSAIAEEPILQTVDPATASKPTPLPPEHLPSQPESMPPQVLAQTQVVADPVASSQTAIPGVKTPGLPEPELTPTQPIAPILEPPIPQPVTPPPSPPSSPPVNVQQVNVRQIKVTGSSIFSATKLAEMVKPFEGRSLTIGQLRSVADEITQAYLNLGYLTSRAVLTEQTITDGVVQIQVIEGQLERVDVLGTKRVNPDYIRRRIQLGSQSPLNQQKLEDQLRLLKFDPLFENVEASLREGTGKGQSILTVRVAEAPPFFGNINLDNDSVPSVGGERIGILGGYRNLTGTGDQVYAAYNRSFTGGADLFDFGYQIPLNPQQGLLQLRIAPSRYRITQKDFKALDIEGSSTLYDISLRQPFKRTPREELAFSLGFTHRNGKTLIADFLLDESTTTVLRFGQEWLKRDPRGVWSLRSQFNLGTGLLGATRDRDPDGQFFSWTGQIERVQLLNADNTLILQTNLQLTPHALLPSQQFVMGGRQSLRGYRQNQRSADNGINVSIENQITLARNAAGEATFQLAPFFDAGVVWNNPDNPAQLSDRNFLAGLGIGLQWKPIPKLSLRLDYGLPLIKLPDRNNNLQDAALYFSLNYRL
jgi:hemolysin activation/secretion protein